MSPKTKSIGKMAADLAGIPEIEQEVDRGIRCSIVISHLISMRIERDITQEEVATKMKCDPSKISRLESGTDLGLKWVDVARYASALGYQTRLTFEDPTLPSAERIKQCVFQIAEDLERLTRLVASDTTDKEMTAKIRQFSGEVLVNFLLRYKDHADRLRSVIKVDAQPPKGPEGDTDCESAAAEDAEAALAAK